MSSAQIDKKILEIRWHGRGGQGAKTASLLLGDAMMGAGKHIQAFPEYGPERMGAPVQSYNRISDEPIYLHCGITSPNIVIVLDSTLINVIDVTQGLPDDGIILINTSLSVDEIRKKMNLTGQKVCVVNATKISTEIMGRNIPNTPMLGALVQVTGLLEKQAFLEDTRAKLGKKFKSKPEIVEGNIKAIQRAMEEVQSG